MINNKWQIVKILDNAKVSGKYFKLSFSAPAVADDIKPGQFIEVKVSDAIQPLLRKPLSLHRVLNKGKKKAIEILYEVVGEGTEILSRKKQGEPLDIIGPLGNGFSWEPGAGSRELAILVAGGIGVAPLMMLAEKLVNGQWSMVNGNVVVLLGAKTKKQILCEQEFKKLGCKVKIATDDGSKGLEGFVTDLLESFLSTINYKPSTIYACGPKPMLKEIAYIAQKKKISCQLLLEEYMACGIGACLGCAVMTKNGYKMVCKDGPVFEAGELIWE